MSQTLHVQSSSKNHRGLMCRRTDGGRSKRVVKIDPRIGFTIPDDPKSVIKTKKVYLSPSGPGFSGEW